MEESTTVTPMGAKVWPRGQNKGVRTVMKYDAWALHPVAFRVCGMHGEGGGIAVAGGAITPEGTPEEGVGSALV